MWRAPSAVDKASQCYLKTKGKVAPRSERTTDNSSLRTPHVAERRSSVENSKILNNDLIFKNMSTVLLLVNS